MIKTEEETNEESQKTKEAGQKTPKQPRPRKEYKNRWGYPIVEKWETS